MSQSAGYSADGKGGKKVYYIRKRKEKIVMIVYFKKVVLESSIGNLLESSIGKVV